MIEFCRIQIVRLGTGITYLRRAVTREEVAFHLETALLRRGLSGVRYVDRPRLKSQIVSAVLKDLFDVNHVEVYRELPDVRTASFPGPRLEGRE